MSDRSFSITDDDRDELEDLEPEPGDAENVKGGATGEAEPTGHGGKGGSS
ncbi:MAG: hypothetical protein ACRDZ7_00990 [Acidimicrobiia bacterium]